VRLVGATVTLLLALVVGGTVAAAPALALTGPNPYVLPANDTPLINLLDVPDTIPTPGPPTIPGTTTADGAAVLQSARIAARVLPALRLAGTIGLGVTAFQVGWKIGSPLGGFIYQKLTSTGTMATGTGGAIQWRYYTPSLQFITSALPNIPGWAITGTGGTCNNIATWDYPNPGGFGCTDAAETANVLNVASTSGAHELLTGPFSGTYEHRYWFSESEFEAKVTRTPSNATEYATLPHASPDYTAPTTTSTDLANARATLGQPVVGKNPSGQFIDGSGNVLTSGQVVAQTNLNCRLDTSYCAGGANDPTGTGGPLEVHVVAPSCLGLTGAACQAAYIAAGWPTAKILIETLDTDGAIITKPAGATITQTPAPTTVTTPDTPVHITQNPDPLPLELPQPDANETADHYKARLVALGLIGSVIFFSLADNAGNPDMGPDAPAVITVPQPATGGGTTTITRTLTPGSWPLPLPRITPDTPVTIYRNPPGAQPAPEPLPAPGAGGGGGSCSCPPIDLSPLTSISASTKFPFGLFAWAGGILGTFDVSPVAPGFDIPVTGVTAHYAGDLHYFNGYMSTIRGIESVVMWIGAIWFLAASLLGFRATGNPVEALDDGIEL
jgi:hypothetical protein